MQAGAVEISGSRCPGSCQRLGAGEEPADGDRVAEKGGELGAYRSRRLMWGPQHQVGGRKSVQEQRQRSWDPYARGLGAAGTQSLRNVHTGKEWGAEGDSGLERSSSRLKGIRRGRWQALIKVPQDLSREGQNETLPVLLPPTPGSQPHPTLKITVTECSWPPRLPPTGELPPALLSPGTPEPSPPSHVQPRPLRALALSRPPPPHLPLPFHSLPP